MTFNIRFDTPVDAEAGNRWADRRESVRQTVRREAPDVIGFQEALASQLADLVHDLPDYHSVGKARQAGEVGEYVPVFFSAARFALEASGDFWLSLTPELEGSVGWDARDPRHCTWTVLRDRDGERTFAVFNTHLDRWGANARVEGARLIVARRAIAGSFPAVVMGDLNAREDSDVLMALRSARFRDSFRDVHPEETDVATVHHYQAPDPSRKIDYILCDEHWKVLDARIVREQAGGRLPSDHFPVVAELSW
jgi:endonuclease/exonuclease/phosphatase family metal-dependent hydrolase